MSKIHQVHAALAASYGSFLSGILHVWPSYTASLYTDKNTTLVSAPMTDVDVSLIGSLPSLGAMLGTIIASKIANIFGRRKGGLILNLPILISWITIYLTKSSIVIMIARFASGCSFGSVTVYAPLFISETAEDSIRGLLASGPIVSCFFGSLVSYIFGWLLTYRYVIWANIGLSIVGLVITLMVTESPVWLVRQKREADARLAFARYRGVPPESTLVIEEISRLKDKIVPATESCPITDENSATEAEKEKLKVDEESGERWKNMSPLKMIVKSPSTRRAFVVTALALSFQSLMGLIPVQVYAKEIFANAIPSLSSHLCSVMFAVVLFCGSLTSAAFADKFGRRTLLLVSAALAASCLITMGVLIQTNILPTWVIAVVMLVNFYAFMFGSGCVPFILLTETFIPQIRSTAITVLMEWLWLLAFIHLEIIHLIMKYLGVHGTFYWFSIFGILEALVAIFLLPETKGLTNDQIQEAYLEKRKI